MKYILLFLLAMPVMADETQTIGISYSGLSWDEQQDKRLDAIEERLRQLEPPNEYCQSANGINVCVLSRQELPDDIQIAITDLD